MTVANSKIREVSQPPDHTGLTQLLPSAGAQLHRLGPLLWVRQVLFACYECICHWPWLHCIAQLHTQSAIKEKLYVTFTCRIN